MSRAVDIMKAISMFDTDEDFKDREARDKLAILFRELVMSDEPQSKEFLDRFLDEVDTIISDMGIIEKPEEADPDAEVDMPDEEPVDDTGGEDIPVDEEPPAEEEIPPAGDGGGDIPDDLLGAGFDPLISMANGFLDY